MKQNIVFLIFTRALCFPFFTGLALVGALIMFLTLTKNFILHGGEAIAYTEKDGRKTIQDVYHKLRSLQEKDES